MIQLENVSKSFDGKMILTDFSVSISNNEFVTVMGKSGSGKTTLLNLMGLLDVPDKGNIKIMNVLNPRTKDIEKLRRYHFGYIFQNYVLIENKTVQENLLLSAKFRPNMSRNELINALSRVKLDESFLEKKVYQLSGGEQQRLAVARIIIKPCDIIFADEPTGNLDEHNKRMILSLFQELREEGKTIICVTHDREIAEHSSRTINL
ncbi:ABC transporter ATP-binding protein [Paenibacillus nasutitermitis]|uniref:ABC transporter ATP-binding protein n=1 Tax=Paenibacillus nasutitermitis TaxID=1652958 RepID=A0A916ZAQ5_9BACL|nr:ABC transporter ATP-binding protein [Paenibacillus nasutitermitis]GGD84546.1 ABC transporter ATP-binding protein [Paenibacillus nasutitermitis]